MSRTSNLMIDGAVATGAGSAFPYPEPRALTNRERARLQSYPDNFMFEGSNAEVRRQIGNSVPPAGVWELAKKLVPRGNVCVKQLLLVA